MERQAPIFVRPLEKSGAKSDEQLALPDRGPADWQRASTLRPCEVVSGKAEADRHALRLHLLRQAAQGVEVQAMRSGSVAQNSQRRHTSARVCKARLLASAAGQRILEPGYTPFRQPRSFASFNSIAIDPSEFTGCSQAHAIGFFTPGRISNSAES